MRMRGLAACTWLALAAAAPPTQAPPTASADAAGNRMVRFAAPPAHGALDPYPRHCTADRSWCARLYPDEAGHRRLELYQGAAPPRFLDLAPEADEESGLAIWPALVIEANGAVLVGVERTRTTGYSGGGASATALVLVRAEPGGGAPRPVLEVPLRGSKDIRACFGARDTRHRRGACSDQYDLAAALTLDPATRAGRPRFFYASQARTYPGRRTQESDSTTEPPLRASDLRWWTDPVCTFQRGFAFDAAAGRYLPERPLPACADYLDF